MPAAAKAVPHALVELIPLKLIDEAAYNPRKTFVPEDQAELAADIRLRGILQPVLLRRTGKRYELVFGARRFRAALEAGLKEIPAMVRVLSDREALEIAIVENAKRSDVHPLEEADAYRQLHETYSQTVDEIAERVGKSKGWVYGRLKLCHLSEAVRKAFFDKALPASHALLLARIPSLEEQDKALEAFRDYQDEGFLPYREAEELIQHDYQRELKGAPFDPADPDLVPAAGGCKACPKRMGNMGEAKGRADVCTDTSCFKTKAAAAGWLKQEAAQKAGLPVFTGRAAEDATRSYGSSWISPSTKIYLGTGEGGSTTYGELAELAGVELQPAAIAIGEDGAARELSPMQDVLQALAEKGNDWAKAELRSLKQSQSSSGGGHDGYREEQAKRQKDAKRRRVVAESTIKLAVAELEAGNRILNEKGIWRLFAELALAAAGMEARKAFAVRRGLKKQNGWDSHPEIEKVIKAGLSAQDLSGVALELLISDTVPNASNYGVGLQAAAGFFHIDVKKAEAQLRAEAKKAKKPAAKKKGGKR